MMALKDAYRSAFARYPSGVAIITARGDDGASFGLTSNSFCAVSLDPPLVAWSLRTQSRHLALFMAAGTFAASVLSVEHAELGRLFASQADDKFAHGDWVDNSVGDPVLVTAVSRFACRVSDRLPRGDHILFLGEAFEITSTNASAAVYYDRTFGAVQRLDSGR